MTDHAEGGKKNTLQKSYSFDNIEFSSSTVDPKDIGSVQKAIQTLSSEATADIAKFTADELAATVKSAGPQALVESGAIDKLKGLVTDNATKANAFIVITELAKVCGSAVEPLLVSFLPSIIEAVSHKKKEIQLAAEAAGVAIIDILCPWAIRVVQGVLFAGAQETKWQTKAYALNLIAKLAEKHPKAFFPYPARGDACCCRWCLGHQGRREEGRRERNAVCLQLS